ncbi:MAG: cytochrome o ubiquinol oxidase subunit IV [Parachlamydiaceae bacterium]|nr:cytochrome o ubiquinol oxidase subunit IV [Parachlamydiaceae bacterium]
MHEDLSLKEIQKEWHGTLRAYVIGFIACIILTATSFFIVATKLLSGQVLIYTIVCLALVQAVIQLLYFLHLGEEYKPRWETIVFYFMVMILIIIAFGSLWIMDDLNDRVMSNMPLEQVHD